MKRTCLLPFVAFLLAISPASGLAQTPHDLFQQALVKERAEGNLDEAIELYQRVVAEAGTNRELAARALVQVGGCYEKLGNEKAREAYERVIREYADQSELAADARTRLAALEQLTEPDVAEDLTIRQVWAGPGISTSGAPSPDGRYLSHATTNDLTIREIATGEERRLTDGVGPQFASTSRWSPDSKRIVYKWYNEDTFSDLRIIGLDGSGPRVIFQNKELVVSPSDWSPDGKHILATFAPREGTSSQIVLVSVADGSVRVLKTSEERDLESKRVLFSPNGEYIAYDFAGDIFLLSTDGNREIPLIEHPANDGLLGWTPNGKSILFASDRTGTWDMWLIQVEDGEPQGTPELIRKDIGQKHPMGFTSKGSFYFSIETTTVDVYIATLDMKEGKFLDQPRKVVQRFEGFNTGATWSPDGNHLAYISYRSVGGTEFCVLCLRSVETGEIREVSTPQLDGFKYLRWAPDSRSITTIGLDKTKTSYAGIYRIDVQTGYATSIVQFERGSTIRGSAWSLDGKSIFYAHTHWTEGLSRILVRDLETGQERELYRQTAPPDIGSVTLSPDGQKLAFLTAAGDTVKMILTHHVLRVIPAAGGKPYDLVKAPVPEGEMIASYAWTPTGREILLAKRVSSGGMQEQQCELWMIPTEGGEPRKLLTMENIIDLSLHPDGQRIAFVSGIVGAEIWVMENFLPPLEEKQD